MPWNEDIKSLSSTLFQMKGQGLNKAAVESLVRDGLQGLQRELDIHTLTLEAMEQKR